MSPLKSRMAWLPVGVVEGFGIGESAARLRRTTRACESRMVFEFRHVQRSKFCEQLRSTVTTVFEWVLALTFGKALRKLSFPASCVCTHWADFGLCAAWGLGDNQKTSR